MAKPTTAVKVITDEHIRSLPPMVKFVSAAAVMGIGRTKAFALRKAGQFPVRVEEIGGRYYVPRAALLTFLGTPERGTA